MRSKLLALTLSVALGVTLLAGCSSKAPASSSNTTSTTTSAAKTDDKKADAATGASQATDEASFEQKIGKDGNYIIITNKDLTFTKDLTVDGTFTKKGKDGKEVVSRSLAFAAESADKKITNRYTVTVPRIVINSENTLLEYGIIKGDVYVQAKGFKTKDATINGNLYFANQDLMNAFKADNLTKINGKVEVKAYTK